MADKKDTIKLEMPHTQAKTLADIIHALASCLETPSNTQYTDEVFPHKWKGIEYTTFADMKMLYNKDDHGTIVHIDEHLEAGILFAYYFKRPNSAVLTYHDKLELPESSLERRHGKNNERFGGPSTEEKYSDIMLFPRKLIGMELSKPPRYEIDQAIIDVYTETATGLKSGKKYLLAYLYYCQGMSLEEVADTLSWTAKEEKTLKGNVQKYIREGRKLAEENDLPTIHRYSR